MSETEDALSLISSGQQKFLTDGSSDKMTGFLQIMSPIVYLEFSFCKVFQKVSKHK